MKLMKHIFFAARGGHLCVTLMLFSCLTASMVRAQSWNARGRHGWVLIDRQGRPLTRPGLGPIYGSRWSSYFLVCPYGRDSTAVLDGRGKIVLRAKHGQTFQGQLFGGLVPDARLRYRDGNIDIGPCGFVTLRGVPMVPQILGSGSWYFWDGLAAARLHGHKLYGFIDEHGHWVVPPKYFYATGLGPVGLAAVEIHQHPQQWGFVDATGRLAFTLPTGWHVGLFGVGFTTDRLARVWRGRGPTTGRLVDHGFAYQVTPQPEKVNREYGFINMLGKLVIPMRHYADIGRFRDGRVRFAVLRAGRKCWGYMDRQGRIVVSPRLYYASSFHERLALVQIAKNTELPTSYAYINREGKVVLRFGASSPMPEDGFRDGRALVTVEQGGHTLCGFINMRGQVVVPTRYRYASNFHNGVAAVELPPRNANPATEPAKRGPDPQK